MQAAAAREQQVKGWPTVAILYYPDVDVFQREFLATLEAPETFGGRCRILRLPRAALSTSEAELVLSGFTDSPDGSWNSIADVYVWGSLVKRASGSIDGEVITDAATPEIELNVWDGKLSPLRFVEESDPVPRMKFDEAVAAQAHRLAQSVAEFVRHPREGKIDETQRARISRALVRAAEENEKNATPTGSFLTDAKSRFHFLNTLQTLEAALLFDPANANAFLRLNRLRWGKSVSISARDPVAFALGRSEAWGHYAELFGIEPQGPSNFEQLKAAMAENPVDHAKVHRLMQASGRGDEPVSHEVLRSAIEAQEQTGIANYRFYSEMPEGEAHAWRENLTREVAHRTVLVAGRPQSGDEDGLYVTFESRGPRLYALPDPHERIRTLEQAWPGILQTMRRKGRALQFGDELRHHITETFTQAGRAGGEKRYFDDVQALLNPAPATPAARLPEAKPAAAAIPPPSPAPDSPPAPMQLFRYQPGTFSITDRDESAVRFDALARIGVQSVEEMVVLDHRLWIIGEAVDDTPVPGQSSATARSFSPVTQRAKRLFVFDPVKSEAHRVESAKTWAPSGLLAAGGKLWITFGRDGVALLDPKSEGLHRFTPEEGFTAESAYRLTAGNGRIYLTGGMSSLFEYDPQKGRWSPHPSPKWGGMGGDLRHLACTGHWLLQTHGTFHWEDLSTGQWRTDLEMGDYKTALQRDGKGPGLAADADGFLLWSDVALEHLDPASGALTVELEKALYALQVDNRTIAEAVTELARERAALRPAAATTQPWLSYGFISDHIRDVLPDGDLLWLTVKNEKNFPHELRLWDRPSRRWLGQWKVNGLPAPVVDGDSLWFARIDYGRVPGTPKGLGLYRVDKAPLVAGFQSVPDVAAARTTFEQLPLRDQAFHYFALGQYKPAATLFSQVGALPVTDPAEYNAYTECLFMQALCYDAQGLRDFPKARLLFQSLLSRYPLDMLAEPARQQLAALPPS
jgi:hypothetical protein